MKVLQMFLILTLLIPGVSQETFVVYLCVRTHTHIASKLIGALLVSECV